MRKVLITLLIGLLGMVNYAMAQSIIKGRVTDEKGEGIYASLRSIGSNYGTTTDDNGYFSIKAEEGEIVEITSAGFKKAQIAASPGMIVKMVADKKTINEVVVTALQVKKEKKSLGYSSTTINNTAVTQGRDRSMLSALAGKVAGVNITNTSGSPGSGTRVVIRGGSSITGDNQALIVVDGVPMDNSNSQNGGDNLNNQIDAGNRANDINPDDIESMTVLKGPAASALFGSRGANGAIIITTKKGKGGAAGSKRGAQVSYSTNIGASDILMFPKFQNDFGQGYDAATHLEENWSWGPKFDGQLRPWGNVVNGKQKVKPFVALPSNVKDFFNRGSLFENNLSIGGGTELSNYFISFNNLNSKGIVDNTGYNRNTFRINAGQKLSNNLEAQIGLSYANINSNLFAGGQANNSFYDQVYQTPRDIPIRELRDYNDPFNNLEGYYGAYTINPYFVIDNYKNTNKVNRLSGNLDLTYKPAKWLTLLNRTTNDFYIDNLNQYQPRYNVDRDDFGIHIEELGNYSIQNNVYNELNNDIIGTTDQKLTKDIGLKALLGWNVRQRTRNNSFTETRGGLVSNGWNNLSNTADSYNSNNFDEKRRWFGAYTDLGFSFKDYLFANFTARNDWSSSLPAGKNSYFYPGANVAFVLTDFLKSRNESWDNKYVNYVKLRAGSARTGNDARAYLLENYLAQAYLTDGFNNSELIFPVNGTAALTLLNGLANNAIRPEIIVENEVGTELAFFKNRMSVDFSLYARNSKDLIIPVDLGPSTGFNSATLNAGKITNRGIELAIQGTPIMTKSKFKWDIFGTYTRNRSNVAQLDAEGKLDQLSLGGLAGTSIVAALNRPYGLIYTRGMQRSPDGSIVVDGTGMPILDATPKLFGTYQPDWMASWGSDFSFKGFKLHALFNHKQGGMIYSRNKDIMEFVGTSASTIYNDRNDFVVPNSVVKNADGTFSPNTTKVSAQTFWTEQSNGELNLIPATFTKLRELSLSYSIPTKVMSKTKLTGASVGLYGNNLFIWLPKTTNMFGNRVNEFLDPEINGFGTGNVQGLEFGTTPSLRNYGINLKVTL